MSIMMLLGGKFQSSALWNVYRRMNEESEGSGLAEVENPTAGLLGKRKLPKVHVADRNNEIRLRRSRLGVRSFWNHR